MNTPYQYALYQPRPAMTNKTSMSELCYDVDNTCDMAHGILTLERDIILLQMCNQSLCKQVYHGSASAQLGNEAQLNI